MKELIDRNRPLLPLVFLLMGLYVMLAIFLPDAGYDKYFWVTWTRKIMAHGMGSIYVDAEVNNNPLVMWLLWGFGTLFSAPEAVTYGTINLLKLLIIPFDLLAIFMVGRKLMKTGKSIWWALVILLNPAFWYNTLIWGQIDTVHTTLVMLSLILAERGRWNLAWLFFILALNVKLQAVIFLPLVFVLTIRPMRLSGFNARWRIWAFMGALQLTILLPFLLGGHFVETLQALVGRATTSYPVMSRHAYNIYYLMARDPFNTPDTNVALGIAVRWWGLALFCLASALVLLPLMLTVFNRAFNNLQRSERLASVFQSAALVALAFFLFNTQMHERYLHPAILFSGLYALMTRQWWPYIMLSVGYLLNMEGVMHFAQWVDQRYFGITVDHSGWFIFNTKLIAATLCGCFIMATSAFYRTFMVFRNNVDQHADLT